jgi:hypothetical protein
MNVQRLIIQIWILVLPATLSAENLNSHNDFHLAKNTAGSMALGMAVDKLYSIYGKANIKQVDLESEGQPTPALEIYLRGDKKDKPSLVAAIEGVIIGSAIIYNPRFRTDKGIGVGSLLGDLRKHYKVNWIGSGEGIVVARVDELGMSFVLNPDDIPKTWTASDDKSMPNKTRIISILLN